jgi:hypothetical protein
MEKANSQNYRLNWSVVLAYTGVVAVSIGIWGAIIRAAESLVK